MVAAGSLTNIVSRATRSLIDYHPALHSRNLKLQMEEVALIQVLRTDARHADDGDASATTSAMVLMTKELSGVMLDTGKPYAESAVHETPHED